MQDFVNLVSSDFFANLCELFSAIGTVSAVVLSLYILFSQRKVKVFISTNTIDIISPYSMKDVKSICGYSATICNTSNEKNIYLKQPLYVKMDKPDEKGKSIMMLIPIVELNNVFPHKESIGPGEDFTFFISEKHIRYIMKNNSQKNIFCYFMDKNNKKYKFKIKRKDLEERMKYIEKNKDKIVAY
ncbi:MAG: hypothetical protein ACI4U4_02905 [Bacilli bacterium]